MTGNDLKNNLKKIICLKTKHNIEMSDEGHSDDSESI